MKGEGVKGEGKGGVVGGGVEGAGGRSGWGCGDVGAGRGAPSCGTAMVLLVHALLAHEHLVGEDVPLVAAALDGDVGREHVAQRHRVDLLMNPFPSVERGPMCSTSVCGTLEAVL